MSAYKSSEFAVFSMLQASMRLFQTESKWRVHNNLFPGSAKRESPGDEGEWCHHWNNLKPYINKEFLWCCRVLRESGDSLHLSSTFGRKLDRNVLFLAVLGSLKAVDSQFYVVWSIQRNRRPWAARTCERSSRGLAMPDFSLARKNARPAVILVPDSPQTSPWLVSKIPAGGGTRVFQRK